MRSLKRIAISITSIIILLSSAIVANAETSQQTINNNQSKLQRNKEIINQKINEKQNVTIELQALQNNLKAIEVEIANNNEQISVTLQEIEDTKALIEQKKEQIVVLEDKVHARKGVMEERLVSLQHNDQSNLIINIILDSESLSDLVQRVSAVSTILTADKDLLEQQKLDLAQIESEKLEIENQEKALGEKYTALATMQAELDANLQQRQQDLASVQEKYNTIVNEITLAEQEKAKIQEQITIAQLNLKKESEAAQVRKTNIQQTSNTSSAPSKEIKGKELYVTATAYSHETSKTGLTYLGYNVRTNPHMKLIAVDPSVIPLGSKVWVEGYGEAIAGDTGSAIKGHIIDVLMPSGAHAIQWGRKTVKIIILN